MTPQEFKSWRRDIPPNGKAVEIAWITWAPGRGHVIEVKRTSRWLKDHWEGNWTPTHWRAVQPD